MKKNSAIRKLLAIIFLCTILVVCFIVFSNVWYNAATNVKSTTKLEIENYMGETEINATSTTIITNYFPLRSQSIMPIIYKREYNEESKNNKKYW